MKKQLILTCLMFLFATAGAHSLSRIVGGSDIGSVWGLMSWTKQAGMRSLETIDGSEFAQAGAINDAGQIIGHANLPTTGPSFYTSPGVRLRYLKGIGGNDTYASAINQNAVIVGSAIDTANATPAVPWHTPTSTPIVLPLGAAYGLNNAAQVVGDGPDTEL